jgi:hypothetical protein
MEPGNRAGPWISRALLPLRLAQAISPPGKPRVYNAGNHEKPSSRQNENCCGSAGHHQIRFELAIYFALEVPQGRALAIYGKMR